MQFVNNIFIEEESQPDLVKKKSVNRMLAQTDAARQAPMQRAPAWLSRWGATERQEPVGASWADRTAACSPAPAGRWPSWPPAPGPRTAH